MNRAKSKDGNRVFFNSQFCKIKILPSKSKSHSTTLTAVLHLPGLNGTCFPQKSAKFFLKPIYNYTRKVHKPNTLGNARRCFHLECEFGRKTTHHFKFLKTTSQCVHKNMYLLKYISVPNCISSVKHFLISAGKRIGAQSFISKLFI